MKDLVDRARAAMNLILVASLVLIWVSLQPPPESTAALAKQIIDTLSLSQEVTLPDDFRNPTAVPSINVRDFLNAGTESLEAIVSGPKDKDLLAAELFELEAELEELAAKGGDEGKLEQLSAEQLRDLVLDIQARKHVLESRGESLRLRAAAIEIEELRNIHAPFRDDEALTFQQLDERLQSKVKIPFIEQEVPGERALILISVGLAGPYLYLLSILWAMRGVSKQNVSEESLSWIFFHPNWLGPIVGVLWLLLPLFSLAAAFRLRPLPFYDLAYILVPMVSLSVLAVGCLMMAHASRKRLERINCIKRVPFDPRTGTTQDE